MDVIDAIAGRVNACDDRAFVSHGHTNPMLDRIDATAERVSACNRRMNASRRHANFIHGCN
jgi:hypothetical protein